MDTIKNWLLEVALKKMGPSAIRAVLAIGISFIMAHAGILEKVGLVYNKEANDLILHLTTLNEWLLALGIGAITAILRAGQHHITEAVSPTEPPKA